MLRPPEFKVLARAFSEAVRGWQPSTRLWGAQVPCSLGNDSCLQLCPPVLRWVIHRVRLIRLVTGQHCLHRASGRGMGVPWEGIYRREEVRSTTAEGMERHLAERPTSTLSAVYTHMMEAQLVALHRSPRA